MSQSDSKPTASKFAERGSVYSKSLKMLSKSQSVGIMSKAAMFMRMLKMIAKLDGSDILNKGISTMIY